MFMFVQVLSKPPRPHDDIFDFFNFSEYVHYFIHNGFIEYVKGFAIIIIYKHTVQTYNFQKNVTKEIYKSFSGISDI